MPLVNEYVDSDIQAGKKGNAALSSGAGVYKFVSLKTLTTDDSANSIFKFGAGIPGNAIITKIEVDCTALTGMALAIGIYPRNSFVAKDEDAFVAALDVATAAKGLDGASAVAVADSQKKLFELAGDSNNAGDYDLGFKISAAAAGSVAIKVEYIEGN